MVALSQIHHLVTDSTADPDQLTKIEAAGVRFTWSRWPTKCRPSPRATPSLRIASASGSSTEDRRAAGVDDRQIEALRTQRGGVGDQLRVVAVIARAGRATRG